MIKFLKAGIVFLGTGALVVTLIRMLEWAARGTASPDIYFWMAAPAAIIAVIVYVTVTFD